MLYTYRPRGVCSQLMEIETENNILKSVRVLGGCAGNLQVISRLVSGMDVDEVIARLEGIRMILIAASCILPEEGSS